MKSVEKNTQLINITDRIGNQEEGISRWPVCIFFNTVAQCPTICYMSLSCKTLSERVWHCLQSVMKGTKFLVGTVIQTIIKQPGIHSFFLHNSQKQLST